ncbi:MAG: aldehyde dehydrogenase [Thermoleophilia bacterium]|nr:aldehyde dehydrogenase [Thermoleophilia bacterium]
MLNATETIIRGPEGQGDLGAVRLADAAALDATVSAAKREQRAWAALPVRERADALDRAASLLEPQADELGSLLAAESGKPIGQARREIGGTIWLLRANADEGRRTGGRVLPTEGNPGTENDLAYTRREPLGLVAAIIPFNFPAELLVEKAAAALVAGNAVVVKPPLEDPLTAMRVVEALIAGGVPSDILGVVNGGRETGAALVADPRVDAVSLTGSTAAGISVAEASAPLLRPLHLELGGNNACLVLDDADLDLVTSEVAFGRLMMNGQACSASKRVIVHRSRHDELADRLIAVARSQVVGPAADETTSIGPLITATAADRVRSQVAAAASDGARVLHGLGGDGPFVEPTVIGSVPPGAAVARDEEIFGPVFTLIPVGGDAEALSVANGSSFGLMASVFSSDLGRALHLAEHLEAGGVVVNGSDNYRPPVIPFGGVKRSGLGREGLGYTIADLTREKTIVFRRLRRTGREVRE